MTTKLEVGKFYEDEYGKVFYIDRRWLNIPNYRYVAFCVYNEDVGLSCIRLWNYSFEDDAYTGDSWNYHNSTRRYTFLPTTKTFDIHKYFEIANLQQQEQL